MAAIWWAPVTYWPSRGLGDEGVAGSKHWNLSCSGTAKFQRTASRLVLSLPLALSTPSPAFPTLPPKPIPVFPPHHQKKKANTTASSISAKISSLYHLHRIISPTSISRTRTGMSASSRSAHHDICCTAPRPLSSSRSRHLLRSFWSGHCRVLVASSQKPNCPRFRRRAAASAVRHGRPPGRAASAPP